MEEMVGEVVRRSHPVDWVVRDGGDGEDGCPAHHLDCLCQSDDKYDTQWGQEDVLSARVLGGIKSWWGGGGGAGCSA